MSVMVGILDKSLQVKSCNSLSVSMPLPPPPLVFKERRGGILLSTCQLVGQYAGMSVSKNLFNL